MARVLVAIRSVRAERLSCVEAGKFLEFCKRIFRRLRAAFEERGEAGLIDHHRRRVNARAADVSGEATWVTEMFRTRYFNLRSRHFHEKHLAMPMASRMCLQAAGRQGRHRGDDRA